jgi:hypothetical protein
MTTGVSVHQSLFGSKGVVPMARLLLQAVAFSLALVSYAQCQAQDVHTWPQWRGPTRDGQVAGQVWPNRLSEENFKQRWRVELGPSYSGPIVAADRVFVTETKDGTSEVVRALSRETGEQLWELSWEGSMRVPFFASSNGSWIRSTPAYDGESLFVAGMRDVLVSIDASNGKQRWKIDFVEQFGTPLPSFGFVCSPLVDGDYLYVQAGAALRKLDKRTGKAVWKAFDDGGGMMSSAFSSPYIATIAGKRQLLVQTREVLAGVDPESGDVLWSHAIEAFRGMNILTPVVFGDSVFTSAYGANSLLLNIRRKGDKFSASPAWVNKLQGYMSTPVVIGDRAYLHLRNQRFACLDLSSGKEDWISTPYGKYWSLVANGDRILALDQRGELLLIRARPQEADLIDRLEISDDPTWAHLAVCGDEVFIRELGAIAAYEWLPGKK